MRNKKNINQETTDQSLTLDENKIKQIKAKMREYNTYENFLISVYALKKDETGGSRVSCVAFPKSDISAYYNKCVAPLHTGLPDVFFFEQITVNYFKDESGKKVHSSYFTPKSFFDYVKKYYLQSYPQEN